MVVCQRGRWAGNERMDCEIPHGGEGNKPLFIRTWKFGFKIFKTKLERKMRTKTILASN